jgi:hypothetical protein
MLTKPEALKLVREEVEKESIAAGIELGVMDEFTVEFEYGWMFSYQSMDYIRTQDVYYLVGGNAPYIVDKFTGQIHTTGTRHDKQFYIEKYCEYRDNPELFKEEIRK